MRHLRYINDGCTLRKVCQKFREASYLNCVVCSEKRSFNEEYALEARFNFGKFIKSALPVVSDVAKTGLQMVSKVARGIDDELEARNIEQLEARFNFGKFIKSALPVVGDVAKTGLQVASKVARDVEDEIEARDVEYDIDQLD